HRRGNGRPWPAAFLFLLPGDGAGTGRRHVLGPIRRRGRALRRTTHHESPCLAPRGVLGEAQHAGTWERHTEFLARRRPAWHMAGIEFPKQFSTATQCRATDIQPRHIRRNRHADARRRSPCCDDQTQRVTTGDVTPATPPSSRRSDSRCESSRSPRLRVFAHCCYGPTAKRRRKEPETP